MVVEIWDDSYVYGLDDTVVYRYMLIPQNIELYTLNKQVLLSFLFLDHTVSSQGLLLVLSSGMIHTVYAQMNHMWSQELIHVSHMQDKYLSACNIVPSLKNAILTYIIYTSRSLRGSIIVCLACRQPRFNPWHTLGVILSNHE